MQLTWQRAKEARPFPIRLNKAEFRSIELIKENMKKSKLLIVILSLTIIFLAFWFFKKEKKFNNFPSAAENIDFNNSPQDLRGASLTTDVVISDIDKIQKMNLANGELSQANEFEKEDLSGFENFPKIGENGGEVLQQGQLLRDKIGNKLIVQVFHYKSSSQQPESFDPASISRTDEFLCSLEARSCERSQFLSSSYSGLEEDVKNDIGFYWSAWDSEKNKLIGIFEEQDSDMARSYVYVCDTESRKCQRNIVGSLEKSTVPLNAISPSMDKIAVVSNNAKLGAEKKWELIIYKLDDLSRTFRADDISVAIAEGEEEADQVNVVAWSGKEDKIAMGTSNKVFVLDADKGGLSMVYMTPTEEEEEYDWDFSSLYLSPDARFVALVDTGEILDEEEYEQNPDLQTINNLKKIDLETKKVDILYASEGLEMRIR